MDRAFSKGADLKTKFSIALEAERMLLNKALYIEIQIVLEAIRQTGTIHQNGLNP